MTTSTRVFGTVSDTEKIGLGTNGPLNDYGLFIPMQAFSRNQISVQVCGFTLTTQVRILWGSLDLKL
jgi:hypothetical protein